MVGIRRLSESMALDTLWGELVFTASRLRARTALAPQAEVFAELTERTEREIMAQRTLWRAEVDADAGVDVADEQLDALTDEILNDLGQVDRVNAAPRRPRYLASLTRGALLRLGLESQLKRVTPWVAALRTEPEAHLQKHAKHLEHMKREGEAALDARGKAASDRALHRARAIASLFEDVNAARRDTYGHLVRHAAASKLPNDWPERFFKKTSRPAGSSEGAANEPDEG